MGCPSNLSDPKSSHDSWSSSDRVAHEARDTLLHGQSRLDSPAVDMSSALPTEAEILAAVDSLRDDALQMLHEIVAHPSLLGDEKSVQDFMETKFSALNDPQLVVKRMPIHRT